MSQYTAMIWPKCQLAHWHSFNPKENRLNAKNNEQASGYIMGEIVVLFQGRAKHVVTG